MEQLRSFADDRLIVNCVHCSGMTQTRDHVPSRVLLDEPYPDNLPVVPSCASCNSGFSLDEEYFACLVECARMGSPESVERPKIKSILERNPALTARLNQARTTTLFGDVSFAVERERVERVILKLARGHAAFELSEALHREPSQVSFAPVWGLQNEARERFEDVPQLAAWPEVGSRAMQRMVMVSPEGVMVGSDWIDVQEGRYRYLAVAESATVMVRLVISEYLACEALWEPA